MNIGTKLLIIIYAAGLVALGAAPLRKHGGISGYISQLSKEIAGKELELPKLRLPSEIKVELGDPKGVKKTKEVQSSSGSAAKKSASAKKKIEVFDKLEPEDRSALNSLLDKVAR